MSTVYDPPFTSTASGLPETSRVAELKEKGARAFQSATRATTDGLRKLTDSASELVDTPAKRNVTIGAAAGTLGLGFLLGFLVGRSGR